MSIFSRTANKDQNPLDVRAERQRFQTQGIELRNKLETEQTKLTALKDELSTIVLDYELSGDDQSEKKLEKIRQDIAQSHQRIDALSLAIQALDKRAAQFERDLQNEQRVGQIRSAQRHLRLRNEAAERFTDRMIDALAEYKKLIEHSQYAKANLNDLPLGTLTSRDEVAAVVSRELFRLSGEAGLIPAGSLTPIEMAFPGSRPVSVLSPDPTIIRPLVDVLKAAGDGGIELVKNGPAPTINEPVISVETITADQVMARIETQQAEQAQREAQVQSERGLTHSLAEATAIMSKPKNRVVIDHRGSAQ